MRRIRRQRPAKAASRILRERPLIKKGETYPVTDSKLPLPPAPAIRSRKRLV